MEEENLATNIQSRVYASQFANIPNSDDKDAWEYSMRREKQEIVPGIYLGPYSSAARSKRTELFTDGVTHIVCVRDESESKFIKPNFENELEYLVLTIADTNCQNLIPFFPRVRDFINNGLSKGGKVLVHGNAGISRSASLVISYIMDMAKIPFISALTMVQSKRYCVHPNPNFQRQLMEYEPILSAQNVQIRSIVRKRDHEQSEEMAE